METTCISIHDLTLDARLLYVSQSIEDILGYRPEEVIGKSCWEYFHPDEIPFAQAIHGRSIQLDKAAVLHYCQIKDKSGKWVGCECVFTVVHDVLVASTSIYRRGQKSQKRAKDAPVIRQLFSSSPRDPRYHMLQYISSKFVLKPQPQFHEPRAALFLNRFSRTLTIMYATNGLADLLGIHSEQLVGRSFYFCIQENCLREAVKCLESAKSNDSIAYLRFWFRDPRQDDPHMDRDEAMSDAHSSDDDDGGVHIAELMDHSGGESAVLTGSSGSLRSSVERDTRSASVTDPNSRSSSGNSTDNDGLAQDRIFDKPEGLQSRTSSVSTTDEARGPGDAASPPSPLAELEAVVSCTSDGLVVVLRQARPFVPEILAQPHEQAKSPYEKGIFASPWAHDPIMPGLDNRYGPLPKDIHPATAPVHPTAAQASVAAAQGPATEAFMDCIREVAVFTWSLTGINGSLAQYGRGKPSGDSQPESLQIWDPRDSGSAQQYYGSNGGQSPSYHNGDQMPMQVDSQQSFPATTSGSTAAAYLNKYGTGMQTGGGRVQQIKAGPDSSGHQNPSLDAQTENHKGFQRW